MADIQPIFKEYLKTTTENTYIKVDVYYKKAGISYATFEPENRGYYVAIYPITREGCWEKTTCFSGYKKLIHQCSRNTQSERNKAMERADIEKKNIIERVLEHNDLKLEE